MALVQLFTYEDERDRLVTTAAATVVAAERKWKVERVNLYTVELDVVVNDGETIEDILSELVSHWPPLVTNELPIQTTAELVQEVGPAGSWPVVRLTGTQLGLALALAAYAGPQGSVQDVMDGLLTARPATAVTEDAPA